MSLSTLHPELSSVGQPAAQWFRRAATGLIQHVEAAEGRVSRVGTSLIIEANPARRGGAGSAQLAYASGCPEGGVCSIRLLSGTWPNGLEDDGETHDAALPTGCWTELLLKLGDGADVLCLVLAVIGLDNVEYIVRDLVDWDGAAPALTGTPTEFESDVLAPYQLKKTAPTCEE